MRGELAPPSVVVGLAEADLFALAEGAATAGWLFTHGRLTVAGDVLLAARLPDFFA